MTPKGLLSAIYGSIKTKKTAKDVEIKPVANGFIVEVGCKTFVFDDLDKCMGEVKRYFQNPAGVEAEYAAKYWPDESPQESKEGDDD